MYNLEILEKGCEELGITLSDTQKNQFIRFYEYLVEKNKVMNLTGITEFDEVLVKHFLDSLCCVKAVDMGKIKTVMDIGTGAGFPGVPLKIAFPEVEACLLDSLNKRVKFLEETFALLGLEGISAIHGRAEEYAKNKAYREKYDLCVSRAVSGLATLSEYCLPYVKVGGLFVSYKSGSVKEEAEAAEKAVKILGGKIRDIQYFDLPGSEIGRSLVIIEKVKNTPAMLRITCSAICIKIPVTISEPNRSGAFCAIKNNLYKRYPNRISTKIPPKIPSSSQIIERIISF